MFTTSVYFLDCKRARICTKVKNARAGQTKDREQLIESGEWDSRNAPGGALRDDTNNGCVADWEWDCEERPEKYARSFRRRISRRRLPWKTDLEKKKLFCSLVYFEPPNWNIGISFLKMSMVELMVQPSASPCWAEDLDNLRRKYIIFLTQDVWPNKWLFFTYNGTSVQGSASAPRQVSLE